LVSFTAGTYTSGCSLKNLNKDVVPALGWPMTNVFGLCLADHQGSGEATRRRTFMSSATFAMPDRSSRYSSDWNA
jgi:hypothetical protein